MGCCCRTVPVVHLLIPLSAIRLKEALLMELEVTICATRMEFRMKPATYPYRIKLSSTSFSVVKILVIDPIR